MRDGTTLRIAGGEGKLVNAQSLLKVLWEESSRPSLRSLRSWTTSRIIPHIKIGRLVYYDPDSVRAALAGRTVRARN